MNEAEIKKLLKTRAKQLATEPVTEESSGDSLEILEFMLAHENYGIETCYVLEVYPLKALTPLPGTPDFITGIVNIRGRIVSVIDLKKFFDLPEKGLGDLNKLIIVEDNGIEFGILADTVDGIKKTPREMIGPVPVTPSGGRTEYLRGVTDERVIILDVKKILSDEKMVVNEGGAA